MAVTKIIAIRTRLDKRIDYAADHGKTALNTGIAYAANPEKTERTIFVSVLNCRSIETAAREMGATKQRFGKTGGVLGYHIIQSFAPGEITPEQAHTVGLAFVREVFKGRYEAVVGTHLDKAHLHNHIIVNSVSYLDGRKYRSNIGAYFSMRAVSDELCRRNGLSVIVPEGTGRSYAQWAAERKGAPTIRSLIREDIDNALAEAYTFQSFLRLLQQKGYAVKYGPNRKHTTLRPPGASRAIRLDSLGNGYTEASLKERLALRRTGGMEFKSGHVKSWNTRYHLRGRMADGPKKKITGFYALYLRYLYLLRGQRRSRRRSRAAFPLAGELIKLERYKKQFRYLREQGINSPRELLRHMEELEEEVRLLTEERRPLYVRRKRSDVEEERERCRLAIDGYTAALREKRRELALCRRIQEDIPQISQKVQAARGTREDGNRKQVKEEANREYQR